MLASGPSTCPKDARDLIISTSIFSIEQHSGLKSRLKEKTWTGM
jgi:hypothetical protein